MIDRASHIRQESDRFAAVLANTDPTAAVPTCPGWTTVDLLKHLTQVHQFWAAVIGQRLLGERVGEFEENRPELPDDQAQLLALRSAATDDLLAALGSRDAGEEAWSWFPPDQTVDFTWRMQTHEATMHRVDAELTAAQPISPIPAAVAADGVDHVLDVMWNWAPAAAQRRITGTLAFEATDTGQRWLADTIRWSGQAWGQTFTDQAACVRSSGGQAQGVVRGTAEQLDLLMWNRGGNEVTRVGDQAVLNDLDDVLADGIQ